MRLQGPHGVHRFADMCVGRELGAEDVSHYSLVIDHVGDAAWDDAKRFGDAERLAEGAIGVARQEERQAVAAGEAFVLSARESPLTPTTVAPASTNFSKESRKWQASLVQTTLSSRG